MLALSRGGGLPGLSAMPANWTRAGLCYHRPLLAVRATDVRAWLSERGVEFVFPPRRQVDRSGPRSGRVQPAQRPEGHAFVGLRGTVARRPGAAHPPFSQRQLVKCLRDGAKQFGWEKRSAKPGQRREGFCTTKTLAGHHSCDSRECDSVPEGRQDVATGESPWYAMMERQKSRRDDRE